ncbi:hypothetical protein SAMN02745202_02565 [Segatella oulorum]|uniref:Uncharacterized protein n=1 Tax=Segatella oulorum TaxID=28136 RepID=A0A1T4S653_9BACT|nr:hypothetical protein SAMN02745202_02565 [Segatella oulorum]
MCVWLSFPTFCIAFSFTETDESFSMLTDDCSPTCIVKFLPTFTFIFSEALIFTFFVFTFTSSAEDIEMVPFLSSTKILFACVLCKRIVCAVSSTKFYFFFPLNNLSNSSSGRKVCQVLFHVLTSSFRADFLDVMVSKILYLFSIII